MKVVHIVPALFGPDGLVGGAERYALELARHMADVVPTTLATFGSRAREERMGALDIVVLGSPTYIRGQRANPFDIEVFRVLKDADVVHCHQQHVFISSVVAAWCRLVGKRVVVTDLGIFGFDGESKRMNVVALHPGVTFEQVQENTGFRLEHKGAIGVTEPPGESELAFLRKLDPERLYTA